jgi:S1-C subfamily serine protease
MLPRAKHAVAATLICVASSAMTPAGAADAIATIEHVKSSVVAVGTAQPTRSPPFQFRGTGFAVADGTLIVTNAHVLPAAIDPARAEAITIAVPERTKDGQQRAQLREARQVAVDKSVDLALLKISGPPLPALKLRADGVSEGQEVLFTGFPIGAVLGLFPATHRGMVSAITPIAIPQARAAELNAATLRKLESGAFPVFQLDATAYPGNSGSPLFDPATGEVLGVVNMVFVKGTKEAVLTQPSGITYAVPARHLRELLDKVR